MQQALSRRHKAFSSSSASSKGPCRAGSVRNCSIKSSSFVGRVEGLAPVSSSVQPIGNATNQKLRLVRARSGAMPVQCQAATDKMTVAITGATGFVGSRLAAKLASQGHKVLVLTRSSGPARFKLASVPGVEYFEPAKWGEALGRASGVVNLAGEPIATRWNESIKREIKRSRVGTTQALVNAIAKLPADKRPGVMVSASAIGYYGISSTATFSEDSASGRDYLAEVCREWEAAAQKVPSDVRLCILRIGIVLAPNGGALGRMLPIFQLFAGGPLGSGRQWMSWIHREDLVALIMDALASEGYRGVYNGTAPKPVRMSELCSSIGNIMGRPSWLPVPDFALQTLLGEGASVVSEGQRVLPARTQQQGFSYQYADVDSALRQILKS